ncbi:DUF6377 domain-containing protein [Phocaeicola plebeius]|uniref:DUF6377 domain-containing protein n=1 Tax=Phocaeicola plebeius TaxID=310297 RepID=A0A921HIQ2_9BACT|nr:DUF6377 domain-containing protein [Phocaeicola plebeius]HJF81465.1 DUF6377 domain-containing protein [Phocaeicola plebeius]
MRAILFLILFIAEGCFISISAQGSDQRILEQLDKAISQKEKFKNDREAVISQIKQRLNYATDNTERYKLCGELFNLYLHYQADSACHYIRRKAYYNSLQPQPERDIEISINRAEVRGVMGMYNEALAELQAVNPHKLTSPNREYYYFTIRACYGWMADNTVAPHVKQTYLEKTELYRDSLLEILPPGNDRSIVLAEKMILSGQADQAIPILNNVLTSPLDMQEKAYAYYTLSLAYEAKKDTDMEIYYLAQTALIDLKASVREYAALQKLARLVYQQGDPERAYNYVSCSMKDAVACNARLRFLEVTEFYPIIDKAYSDKKAQEKRLERILTLSITGLAVCLILLAFYLYHGLRKLSLMRKNLSKSNKELVALNQQLQQTGKIKEVYIARYLDRCVSYLDKLEQYRRSLEKLAMASRIEDLFKAIRSADFLREERKNFYNEFDKSFLELFPNFIHDFNNLLNEDGKIEPKPGEILNTELRIFALIRLGVTDANRIAHFLGYSLATVYNYRSKIRNKAKGDKDNFEQEVMSL